MQNRQLGPSGLSVSAIGLGTLTWGRDTDDFEAHDLLERFGNAGGNLIDTSPAYGDGAAEALLGEVLRAHDRDKFVICTKVGGAGGPGGALHRKLIRDSAAGSVQRLGVDYLDLLLIQAPDFQTSLSEIADTLDFVVTSGLANYVGVSNLPAWQLALLVAKLQRPDRLVAGEYEYSLLARQIEADVAPACRHLGVSLLAWSPLGRGILTGKYRRSIPADSRAASPHLGGFAKARLEDAGKPIVEAVAAAAAGLGVTPTEVALAWVRDRPGVASIISGARTAGQLETVLASNELSLPAPIEKALSEVSAPVVPYPTAGWFDS